MDNIKKILPYLLAVLFFAVAAYAYTPEVFQGKVVNQSDISSWKGMANEILTHNGEHPDDPAYWTNSMFSGMPAIPISVVYEGDFTDPLYKLLFVGERPASYLLVSMIGAFLMFLAFGTDVWLAVLGAVAVTFCSYNMQIIQVGHNSKMVAIALMPWVMAALVYAYRKKTLAGALLFAFALSFQIKANHPQITYYLAIMVLGYAVMKFVLALKERTLPDFFRRSALLLVFGLLGIATNINHLWPTYEYAGHTMRGGSELTIGNETKTDGGLDMEYATAWSYGPEEMMNLMIPDFNGGASSGELDRDSETYRVLSQSGYQGAGQIIKQLPLYWGPQPFTAGPMYMGAISVFLFVLGLILFKGALKWWVAGVSLLAVLLAWGSHLMFFSEFFFRYAPLYNKFRTVSMILVILQITIPVLGILVLDNILKDNYRHKEFKRAYMTALSLTAGLCLLFAVIPSLAGDFISQADSSLPDMLSQSLREDRADLLVSDAWRSFSMIIAAALIVYLGWNRTLRRTHALVLLTALMLADLWSVDRRYLNGSHFMDRNRFENQYPLRTVDKIILEDTDPDYRVLDLSVNTFNDAYTSYYHKTIGGYSPAKLQRYQDLIQYYITPEISAYAESLRNVRSLGDAEDSLGYYPVLSMLNTKYIILNPDMPPVENRFRNGNAWFVKDVMTVSSPDEEILGLHRVNPKHVALVQDKYKDVLTVSGGAQTVDSAATVTLTHYDANALTYEVNSSTGGVVVFSEIYYPGWQAEVDGKPVEIACADYILRALKVEPGKHVVTFKFDPQSLHVTEHIANAVLIVMLLTLLFCLGREVMRRRKAREQEGHA